MPDSAPRLLLYGATGYTGGLIATAAAERGLDVVLSGRSAERLAKVAARTGLPARPAALDDPAALRLALEDADAVLHVAGPYEETAAPMLEACLATGTHYLDVTGELDVFETIAGLDARAREAGITLLPGVGFDVVPGDCLLAFVAARLDAPRVLRLAIAGGGGVSRGTAKSALLALGEGLRVRRGGLLRRLPNGSLQHRFDFGAGPALGLAMPLGEVTTAFHSTGVPDIEAYMMVAGRVPQLLRASRIFAPLLRQPTVRRFLEARIDAREGDGPDEDTLRSARMLLLAEAEDADGQTARAQLETPNGYAFTVEAALESALRVARGEAPAGFQTPSRAFGADFVLDLPACRRTLPDAEDGGDDERTEEVDAPPDTPAATPP